MLRLMRGENLLVQMRRSYRTTNSTHVYRCLCAIHGWELSGNLTERLTLTALEQVLAQHTPESHHFDQGVQCAAAGYVDA